MVHLCSYFLPPLDRSPWRAGFLCRSTHQLQCARGSINVGWLRSPAVFLFNLTGHETFIRSLPFLGCTNESDFVLSWVEMLYSFEQGWDNFSYFWYCSLLAIFQTSWVCHASGLRSPQWLNERTLSWTSLMAQSTEPRQHSSKRTIQHHHLLWGSGQAV